MANKMARRTTNSSDTCAPPDKADAILTADIHLRDDVPVCRTDDFQQTMQNKILWLAGLAKKYNCPVLDAGDLFHRWRVSQRLKRWFIQNGPRTMYSIPGNHDLPQHSLELYDNSAFAVVEAGGALFRVDAKLRMTVGEFPVCGFGHGEEWQPCPRTYYKRKVCLIHTMCWKDKPPYPGAPESGNVRSILKKLPGYDLVVTGDNHQSFTYKDEKTGQLLVNPGSLMRQTADQADFRPRVYAWNHDANTVTPIYVPIEPDVVTREHITTERERDERMEAFVQSLETTLEVGLSFERNMDKFLRKNKLDADVVQAIHTHMDGIADGE